MDNQDELLDSLERAYKAREVALRVVDRMDAAVVAAITECLRSKPDRVRWEVMAARLGLNRGQLWTFYQRRSQRASK